MWNKILLIAALGMSYTAVANDNVPITLGTCADRLVTSTPALIKEGRRLFKEEAFNGNGRTCETCHRENNNFTIDPVFIAKLPKNDPLFVAENNPDLKGLDDPVMLRKFGLILVNSDGFDKPGVLRSTPHLLGLSQTTAIGVREFDNIDDTIGHLVHETGWSADGAPGDGSLRCFPAGAIKQHFTKSMNRLQALIFDYQRSMSWMRCLHTSSRLAARTLRKFRNCRSGNQPLSVVKPYSLKVFRPGMGKRASAQNVMRKQERITTRNSGRGTVLPTQT